MPRKLAYLLGLASILAFPMILITVSTTPVRADCVRNGYKYPEGAVVNGLVCRNGEWK